MVSFIQYIKLQRHQPQHVDSASQEMKISTICVHGCLTGPQYTLKCVHCILAPKPHCTFLRSHFPMHINSQNLNPDFSWNTVLLFIIGRLVLGPLRMPKSMDTQVFTFNLLTSSHLNHLQIIYGTQHNVTAMEIVA